jgi:hypothetical protein
MFLSHFALGPAKRLRHSRYIVPLGLGDQAGQHQQFAPLGESKMREVRSISFDRTQHARARAYIFLGERTQVRFLLQVIHGGI